MAIIKIGTRKSKLALRQTELVIEKLKAAFPEDTFEIAEMSTRGDEVTDRALSQVGGKGLFTREIENALISGQIQMAVHSSKDMSAELGDMLEIGAAVERDNPFDVCVTLDGTPLEKLKSGAVVGTGSLRRQIQAENLNPHINIKLIRGNIHTRLEKLKNGGYDAIILAAAGLERMGISEKDGFFIERFDETKFIPAAGQGIMAVEVKKGGMEKYCAAVNSPSASAALTAERAFLRGIGAGCNAPCGVYAREENGIMVIDAMYCADGVLKRLKRECIPQDGEKTASEMAEEILL